MTTIRTEYRGYVIEYDPPPIPGPTFDWQYTHKDYDGPEDKRHGYSASVEACKAEIDDIEGDA